MCISAPVDFHSNSTILIRFLYSFVVSRITHIAFFHRHPHNNHYYYYYYYHHHCYSVDETRANVQDYYGKNLQSSDDLQTDACCTAGAPPTYIQDCINKLHPTTVAKYYGCGLCLPNYDLTGATILDLGCGAGRDVYIASQLVGPTGHVTGIDMTEEQLATAREFQSYHAEKFGYDNTDFQKGYLESLADIESLKTGSFDVIISNCVINLCTDKKAVLKACYDLLKEGGEMYFSDVYANRRVAESLQKNPLLWGECLSGTCTAVDSIPWNEADACVLVRVFCDFAIGFITHMTCSNLLHLHLRLHVFLKIFRRSILE